MLDALERFRLPLLFLAAFALVAAVWALVERAHDDARPLELIAVDAPPGGIRVHVTGAVERPGVYEFEPGARIADAIEAAGGPTAEASTGAMNQALRLRDEQQLVVPTRQQVEAAQAAGGDKVDLNTAPRATLESLNGIGPVRAQGIIDSRAQQGPFASPEELLARGLVPDSVFDDIRPHIVAGPQ